MDEINPSSLDFAGRYDDAAAGFFDCLKAACAPEVEWPLGVRAAVEAGLRFLADDPARARLLLFEPYDAGLAAQLHHEERLACLAELFRARRDPIDGSGVPEMVEEGLVGSLVFIAGRPLRRGEPEQLPQLAPELTALLLSPYLGREDAERVAFGQAES